MHPDLKELLTRPLLTEALGAGARAAGEFLEGRTQAFGEELDRLADEVGLDRGARTQGPIQDVLQGLDPTGAVVPERDSPNPLIGLAAGLLSPDPMDAGRATRFLDDMRERLPFMDFDDIPDFVRSRWDRFTRATGGAPSEVLNELDETLVEGVINTPPGEESNAALELLASRSGAEKAARAQLGDEIAEVGFREYIEPETFSSDGFANLMEMVTGDSPDYFLDREAIGSFLNETRADEELFKILLGID